MSSNTVGARLRAARERSGLTTAAAGDVVGVTAQTWRNWEADVSSPSVRHLPAICAALEVSATWLTFGRERRAS